MKVRFDVEFDLETEDWSIDKFRGATKDEILLRLRYILATMLRDDLQHLPELPPDDVLLRRVSSGDLAIEVKRREDAA